MQMMISAQQQVELFGFREDFFSAMTAIMVLTYYELARK